MNSNQRSPGVHRRLAVAYRHTGRIAKAIEHFEQALNEDPGDLRSYDDLASAYAVSGRIDHAVEISRRSLEINPTYERALENLRILMEAKRAVP